MTTQQDPIATVQNRLWPFTWMFLRNHPFAVFGFFMVALVWATEMSLSPYLIKVIIDTVNEFEHAATQMLAGILVPAIAYVSLSIVINFNFRFYEYLCLKTYSAIKKEVTNEMFGYLNRHSFAYFQNHFSGTLVQKVMDLLTSIEPVIRIPFDMFIPRFIAIVISGSFLLSVNPIFSVILVTWGVSFVLISYLMSKSSEDKSFAFSKAKSAFTGSLNDVVSNIISAKIFGNISYEEKRVDKAVGDVVAKDRSLQWNMLKIHFVQGSLVTILSTLMICTLVYGRYHGWVTLGDFAFVLTLSSYFVMSIYSIGQEMIRFSKEVGTCRQALTILSQPHDIVNMPNAKPLTYHQGQIQFKDVLFGYEDDKPFFKDFNLTIDGGEKVGLVGFSGGGKSTFVNLLIRLYDVHKGVVTIDGQNIREVTLGSLNKVIGFVPQHPDLFHRSIMDNIRYGNLEASDEEVISAAKRAHCHDFIMELDKQYDSLVGERGVKLSGGQRQRIAIARAILKNAPILILDEATSALDSVTEKYIQESLHEMMRGKTTIVIAHRLSTLAEMDRIICLENGQVIEEGAFAELIKRPEGSFRKLWEKQADGFIPDL